MHSISITITLDDRQHRVTMYKNNNTTGKEDYLIVTDNTFKATLQRSEYGWQFVPPEGFFKGKAAYFGKLIENWEAWDNA